MWKRNLKLTSMAMATLTVLQATDSLAATTRTSSPRTAYSRGGDVYQRPSNRSAQRVKRLKENTDPGNSSTASESPRSWTQNISMDYWADFRGGPVSNPESPYTTDASGKYSEDNLINMFNEITTNYRFTENTGVALYVPFVFVPVMGKGFEMADAGIKVFNRGTISSGGFRLNTSGFIQAPTSEGSRNRNMILSAKFTPSFSFSPTGSRFTFGALTEAKSYLGVSTGKDFKFWALPYVNYRISPQFSLNLMYEMETLHMVGDDTFKLGNSSTDLQPGVIWNITPSVSFQPYLRFFTGNRVGWNNMTLCAIVSATLF